MNEKRYKKAGERVKKPTAKKGRGGFKRKKSPYWFKNKFKKNCKLVVL